VEVTGTIAIPNPAPAIGSVQPRSTSPSSEVRRSRSRCCRIRRAHNRLSSAASGLIVTPTRGDSEAMIIRCPIARSRARFCTRAGTYVLEIQATKKEDREGTEIRAERDHVATREGRTLKNETSRIGCATFRS